VTETGYDQAGRVTAVSVSNRRELPGRILGESSTVAYWPLDELAGSAGDKKGSFTLTPAGGVDFGAAGGITEGRPGVRLDGTGTLSRASNVTALTDNYSADAWIKSDAPPAADAQLFRNGDATNGWGLGVDTSGQLVAQYETGGVSTTLATTKVVADGVWHHVGLVRSGGTSTAYVDGVAYSLTNATTAPGTPGAAFTIGRETPSTGSFFTGEVDEVAIYSAVLGLVTIGDHYADGRVATADANLVTKTRFDVLGRSTDSWDPTGTRTRFDYNRLGNVRVTWLGYQNGTTSSGTGTDDVRSTFAYNAAGELIRYCSAKEFVWPLWNGSSCNVDDAASTSAWHYGYDEAGHLTKQVAPVNQLLTPLDTKFWVYDPGMRLTKACDAPVAATDCSTAHRNSVPVYDGVGRVTQLNTYTGAGTTLALRTDTSYFGTGSRRRTTSSAGPTSSSARTRAGLRSRSSPTTPGTAMARSPAGSTATPARSAPPPSRTTGPTASPRSTCRTRSAAPSRPSPGGRTACSRAGSGRPAPRRSSGTTGSSGRSRSPRAA
jgi:YD repeat-containing protein